MHAFFPHPQRAHDTELPKSMYIRVISNGSHRFGLNMLKSVPTFIDEVVEEERRADEALVCVHWIMENIEGISPDDPYDEGIFFDTETPEDTVRCVVCYYNARKYVRCFHCSGKMCIMCGARSPWKNRALMCCDCLGCAQAGVDQLNRESP